jgi:hypothetical protein
MATTERVVTIRSWPDEAARLHHAFERDESVPLAVSFEGAAASVNVATAPRRPLRVDMPTTLRADKPVPVCLSLCEPICAQSDYAIGIRLFDEMVVGIRIRGRTVIDDCRRRPQRPTADRPPPDSTDTHRPVPLPTGEETCFDFTGLHVGHLFPNPLARAGNEVLVSSGTGSVRITDLGLPSEVAKADIPPEGMEIEFAGAVSDVRLTVNNFSGPGLTFDAYSGSTRVIRREESILNDVAEVVLVATGITSVRILGSRGESSLVTVCFRS